MTPEQLKSRFALIDMLVAPTFDSIKKVVALKQEQDLFSIVEKVNICQ